MEKTLQELTIKDNFMFAAVMVDPDNCKNFLELVLGIKIAKITVYAEKTIVNNPASKGVRLDIESEDENHTHFDVEMQVASEMILRRARYYHSRMDGEMLQKGKKYHELPDAYVIFICDYDPLGKKRYQYTLEQICVEDPTIMADAGTHTIFLSTKGENDDEVSEPLRKFLRYVGAELVTCEEDFEDAYVKQLQESVRRVKRDRELGVRYMLFQEMLDDREEKGREKGQLKERISLIIKKLKKGKNLEQIADEVEIEMNLLTKYMEVITKYAPDYDIDTIVRELGTFLL